MGREWSKLKRRVGCDSITPKSLSWPHVKKLWTEDSSSNPKWMYWNQILYPCISSHWIQSAWRKMSNLALGCCLQSRQFSKSSNSCKLSLKGAVLPWAGFQFWGVICIVHNSLRHRYRKYSLGSTGLRQSFRSVIYHTRSEQIYFQHLLHEGSELEDFKVDQGKGSDHLVAV